MKMVNRISFDLNIPNLAKKIAEVEKEIINLQIKICAEHCTNPSEPNEKKKMMMETDKQLIKMLRAIMTLITPTWDTNRYQVEKAKGILRSNNLDDLVTECKKVKEYIEKVKELGTDGKVNFRLGLVAALNASKVFIINKKMAVSAGLLLKKQRNII